MLSAVVLAVLAGQGEMDARLMRFPDIHGNQVVFTYAGDLWTVASTGGAARKLTNSPGNESLAKFSPDGKWIAFTASYDGNSDVFVMPSEGGEPKRLTSNPASDGVLDWTPDGKNIVFRSARNSPSLRYQGAFMVPAGGGTATALPMVECGLASLSADGKTFAYNRVPTENAAWKRYRGGLQSYISFYDVSTNKYWEMAHDRTAYLWPMWVDKRVLYANDSDGRYNLYSYDTTSKQSKKLTNFNDYDVKWPSYGTGKVIYERDGKLWTYDVASGTIDDVPVRIFSDLIEARSSRMELGDRVADFSMSPTATRLAIEARGELFNVPAKEGLTYNMTKSAGARERYPRWSPDGKWILFASDKTGEYEFYVQKSDLSEAPVAVTSGSSRFYNSPVWAPDSKKFFVTDPSGTLFVIDVDTKSKTKVAKANYSDMGDCVWSPDSKWLAYSDQDSAGFGEIYVYDVAASKVTKLTHNIYDDSNPVFDADSKYLYFVSTRDVNPSIGLFELSFNFENGQRIYGMTLDKDAMSPFAPKNDLGGEAKAVDAKPGPAKMDWDGIEGRMFNIPVAPGQYQLAGAPPGRLLYVSGGALYSFSLAEKKADKLVDGFQGADFTPKWDKMAYFSGGGIFVVPLGPPAPPGAGRVNTADMETTIDPRAEWKQSYWEAWRYERDYYWAPNMNGLDWKAIGDKYAKWLPYLGSRADLDYLLRELLGELSTGHSYVIPGPAGSVRPVGIGMLGADYERAADGVKFKKVYRGQNWDGSRRGPLSEPGMNVRDGDYILAIDGERVGANTNVEELLVGKADKVVEVTVGPTASMTGSRKLLVRPIGDENTLRYADFLESKMRYVNEKSGGRIGYVYVPSTGMDGVIEFHKMFYPQVDKDAMIIDERWNSGGFIPDFFVEKLGRVPLTQWSPRDRGDFRSPGQAMLGPKVMLINHYGGSGGDAFPYFFKKRKIGPLIGTRTWGGLVGINGNRDLMSGGAVTVPQFAVWDVDEKGNSKWVVENVGVSPDIEIDNTPDQVWMGKDPQLDKAIEVLLDTMKKNPMKRPVKPAYYGTGGGK